jgi:transcriptional regulator GlxA family with amidase domain
MMRIETLARELCWTPRQLERRFLIEVGLTPKRLARLVRFQSALSCLPAAPSAATAALDCGFFDQPHMLRDFRSLAGAPPSIVLEQPGALAARLQSDKRLSDYFRAD